MLVASVKTSGRCTTRQGNAATSERSFAFKFFSEQVECRFIADMAPVFRQEPL
jgi:hypothetical protein